MKKGYLDGTVLTDREGLLPVPRFVSKPEGTFECVSSKYTAAPTLAALSQGMKDGFKHIGIVGTPCQVLATALMRSNPLEEDNFVDATGLIVGLFCTWALDFRRFDEYISDLVDTERITKIDIPPPPADIMEVYMEDGEKMEIPLDEIRQLIPEGCSYCIDMTAEFSDISVGVLEGRPDMNTLIIRTERGRKIVDEARKEGYLIVSDILKENLKHLQWAATNKKRKALIKARQERMVNTEDKNSYLRLRTEVLETITA
jgi:coenzyme F420 hydrogenase subunit beta